MGLGFGNDQVYIAVAPHMYRPICSHREGMGGGGVARSSSYLVSLLLYLFMGGSRGGGQGAGPPFWPTL